MRTIIARCRRRCRHTYSTSPLASSCCPNVSSKSLLCGQIVSERERPNAQRIQWVESLRIGREKSLQTIEQWQSQIRGVWKMRSYSARIGFVKHLDLPNGMRPGIICRNNMMAPTRLGTQLENWLQTIFDGGARRKW
jgi:hypothetical protein